MTIATTQNDGEAQAIIDDTRLDADLTRGEIIARNIAAVEAHFHNENPDQVDAAIALYADDIVWEAPGRGQVYTDPADVKASYQDIFKSIKYNKTTALRRFATEQFVFDDQIADVEVVGEHMPNLPYPIGTRMSVRLVHCFEMQDGKITREIAYELWREFGSSEDRDDIPAGSPTEIFDPNKF